MSTLNDEQKMAFETVMNAIKSDDLPHRCFFLDGPGDAGKTYLYKTFLGTPRGAKKLPCLLPQQTLLQIYWTEGGLIAPSSNCQSHY